MLRSGLVIRGSLFWLVVVSMVLLSVSMAFAVSDDSLVSYYKLDGDVLDSEGRFNLSDQGSSDISGQKLGSGRLFVLAETDSMDSNIIVSNSDFSVSGWFNISAGNDEKALFGSRTALINGFLVRTAFNNNYLELFVGNGSWFSDQASSNVEDGGYHMVTLTYDADSNIALLYVDSLVEVNLSSGLTVGATNLLSFGCSGETLCTNYFNGKMDELGFWNRTISGVEVVELFNSSSGLSRSNFGVESFVFVDLLNELVSENLTSQLNVSLSWSSRNISFLRAFYNNSGVWSVAPNLSFVKGVSGNGSFGLNVSHGVTALNGSTFNFSFASYLFGNDSVAAWLFDNNSLDVLGLHNGTLSGFPVPVAHYKFNGNALDEGGLYNGTVTGATLVSDQYGVASRAYSFDGVNDHISYMPLNLTNGYSASLWVKFNRLPSGDVNSVIWISGSNLSSTTQSAGTVFTNGGTMKYRLGNTTAVRDLTAGGFVVDKWYFIVVTNDGSTAKLYVNGTLKDSDTALTPIYYNSSGSGQIGTFGDGLSVDLNGSVDDVQIYDVALSPVEVSRLYNRSSTENHAVSPYVSDHNGVVDSALAFDGVDDYVNTSIELWDDDVFSLSGWVYLPNLDEDYAFVSDHVGAGNRRLLTWMDVGDGGVGWTGIVYNSSGLASLSLSKSKNNAVVGWQYIVFDVSPTNMRLYVDGVLVDNVSGDIGSGLAEGNVIYIGWNEAGNKYLNGSIDDVRVYNRSLGAGDVSSIYNNSGFDFKSQLNYSVVWRHPRLNVTAVMGNGSAISAFNVSIGGVTNGTTNGFLQLVLSGLNNFSVQTNSSGFIGRTDLVNVDSLLTPFEAVLSESVVTFRVFDQFTNVQILNFSVTDGYTSKSTVNGVAVLNMGAGVSTVNVSNNVSYYNRSFSVSVVALQNKSVNLSLFNHKLEVHAFNNLSGAEVFNLSVNVTYPNGSGLSLFSSGNNVTLNLSTGVNYSLSVAPTGYAISRANVSGLSGLSSVLNLSVFTTNSLFITFRDSDSHLLFNTSNFGVNANVTISFIGLSALTRMTDNGSLFVSLLSPDTYTLTYSANGFETGKYIISVVNRSYQALTLYLQNDSEASLVLITVKDRFGTELQGG
jgi:hypothetical protein